MRVYTVYVFCCLLVGSLCITCRQASKDQTRPVVATLSGATFTIGDSVSVYLNQPLSRLTTTWDNKPTASAKRGVDTLLVSSTAQTVGIHQLVVRGMTVEKDTVSDTLSVELLSDIVPSELSYTVLATYPHQTSSFTEGLEFYRGSLYESTGLNGQSRLMKVDLKTGAILKSVALDKQYFGEGITIVNDRIYQLTWTSGLCFRYTMDFVQDKTFKYYTEGWSLTHRDTTLIMSDGSNKLYFFTPDFQKKSELVVYDDKGPVKSINELEYIDGYVFANVWQTNRIIQIDLSSGKVVGYLNMESILPTSIDTKENVLNGIAYQSKEGAFYVTGKNWPILAKIKLSQPLRQKEKTVIALRN